jgi:hypothetical protein
MFADGVPADGLEEVYHLTERARDGLHELRSAAPAKDRRAPGSRLRRRPVAAIEAIQAPEKASDEAVG